MTMVAIFKETLTAEAIKSKARALGADLVGIADGAALERHPPDPKNPQRPSDITDHDGARVIVLVKRLSRGVARIAAWNDRHKYYNDELALTRLEEALSGVVYWLEDNGYPALIVRRRMWIPGPSRTASRKSISRPCSRCRTRRSKPGLGTLGLNLQLLTPGIRPARRASPPVLCSVDVDLRQAHRAGALPRAVLRALPESLPGDAVGHWSRTGRRLRSAPLAARISAALGPHVARIIAEPDRDAQKELVRSEDSFNLWQSIPARRRASSPAAANAPTSARSAPTIRRC
jgi:hypothetical protein